MFGILLWGMLHLDILGKTLGGVSSEIEFCVCEENTVGCVCVGIGIVSYL